MGRGAGDGADDGGRGGRAPGPGPGGIGSGGGGSGGRGPGGSDPGGIGSGGIGTGGIGSGGGSGGCEPGGSDPGGIGSGGGSGGREPGGSGPGGIGSGGGGSGSRDPRDSRPGGSGPDTGEPPPIEVEFVPDDGGPDAAYSPGAVDAGFETIGAGLAWQRVPRLLQLIGAAAAAAALAVAFWPSGPGPRKPVPAPLTDTGPPQVRIVSDVGLSVAEGADRATLSVTLANDTTYAVTLLSAEVRDDLGQRYAFSSHWPVTDIAPHSSAVVSMTMPFVCDGLLVPVEPIALKFEVVASDRHAARLVSYPIGGTWDGFSQSQSTYCGVADSDGLYLESVTLPQSIDLVQHDFFVTIRVGDGGTAPLHLYLFDQPVSGLEVANSMDADIQPWQSADLPTVWHVRDCAHPPDWPEPVLFAEVDYHSAPGTARRILIPIRADLLNTGIARACAAH